LEAEIVQTVVQYLSLQAKPQIQPDKEGGCELLVDLEVHLLAVREVTFMLMVASVSIVPVVQSGFSPG